jgi:tRNA A37 threonylcarbamoyladenosine synthetase subunit TsaC/SUA5/YrdC
VTTTIIDTTTEPPSMLRKGLVDDEIIKKLIPEVVFSYQG